MVSAVDLSAWSEASWATAAAWTTVLVYVVIGVIAFIQVREARRLRIAQARPFVIVDLERSPERIIIDLVIKNVGTTVASDVRLEFDQPVASTVYDSGLWLDGDKAALITQGIATFPPGKSITAMFDSVPPRVQRALPMTYEVTVTYDGPPIPRFLRGPRVDHYEDTYVLDLVPLLGIRNVTQRTIHHAAKALEEIQKELSKWTAGSHGLYVKSIDQHKQTIRDERSWHLDRARQTFQADGLRAAVAYYLHLWLRRHGLD